MEKDKDLLLCQCYSTEHQIIIFYDEDENNEGKYPVCYINIHLNKTSFWRRLLYGIKYIFGYRSKYGAFEEFIINPKDADKLQKVVNYLNT